MGEYLPESLSIVNVAGNLSECIQHPSGAALSPCAEVETVFVMVPGNPGVIEFYHEYLSALAASAAPGTAVVGIGLAGHSFRRLMPTKFSLQQQVAHVSAFLDQVAAAHPNARLVLAGHSVGAFICMQLLHRGPKLPVDKVLFLFPTLDNLEKTPNGRGPRRYACYRYLRNVVPAALGLVGTLLPLRLRRGLVRMVGPDPGVAPDFHAVAPFVLDRRLVGNVTYMAHTEFTEMLDMPPDVAASLEERQGDLIFYYGAKDGWVPVDRYHKYKAMFPDSKVMMDEGGAPHAFCVTHGTYMAKKITQWLPALFRAR